MSIARNEINPPDLDEQAAQGLAKRDALFQSVTEWESSEWKSGGTRNAAIHAALVGSRSCRAPSRVCCRGPKWFESEAFVPMERIALLVTKSNTGIGLPCSPPLPKNVESDRQTSCQVTLRANHRAEARALRSAEANEESARVVYLHSLALQATLASTPRTRRDLPRRAGCAATRDYALSCCR